MNSAITLPASKHRLLPLLLVVAGFALALLSSPWWRPTERHQGETQSPPVPMANALAPLNGTIDFWATRATSDPQNFVAYNKLADAYLRRAKLTNDVSDYTRAETALNASLAVLPRHNLEAEALLPAVYVIKHQFTEALPLAEQLVEHYPTEPFPLGVLGDAQFALGRYDEAERSYRAMLGMLQGPASFSRMAYLSEALGRIDQAELNYRNAVSSDDGSRPEASAAIRVDLGNFYLSRANAKAAEDAYRSALDALPGYVPALAGLAAVDAARGNDERAIEGYSAVLPRNPQPLYVIALGDLYARAGKLHDAEQQYALVRAIGQLYEANGIRSDLTLILFEADHGGVSADVLARAAAAYAERPSLTAADVYGWALYRNGRYEEARARAEEALHLGTQDALLFFHAGMIADRQGDTAAARTYLRRALDINSHFNVLQEREARATLDRLERGR